MTVPRFPGGQQALECVFPECVPHRRGDGPFAGDMVFPPGEAQEHATDPLVLVEVLSEDTAQRDRVEKYAAYSALPGLAVYLIVEALQRQVYLYTRKEEGWVLTEPTDRVDLTCLGIPLGLDEIYDGVFG